MAKNSIFYAISELNESCANALLDVAAAADECIETFDSKRELTENQACKDAMAELDSTINALLDQMEEAMDKCGKLKATILSELFEQR